MNNMAELLNLSEKLKLVSKQQLCKGFFKIKNKISGFSNSNFTLENPILTIYLTKPLKFGRA